MALKSPEISLKQSALRIAAVLAAPFVFNPSEPVHAEVDNGEGSYTKIGDIKRQYSQCNGNKTEWVIDWGDDRYTALPLKDLPNQCGNDETTNQIKITVKGEDLTPSIFYSERYQSSPINLSCPEGFSTLYILSGDVSKDNVGVNKINYGGNPNPEYRFYINKDAADQEGTFIHSCTYLYQDGQDRSRFIAVPFREFHYRIENRVSLEEYKTVFGAVKDDSNYKEKYDPNNDGVINITDFSLLRDKLTQ